MAKKRETYVSRFVVTDEGVEIAGKVEFSLSLFKGDESINHVVNFDCSFTRLEFLKIWIGQFIVDLQNRILRPLGSHAKIRQFLGNTIGKSDVYKSERSTEPESNEQIIMKLRKRGMTKEQILAMFEE